jgi:hypothetical protein
VTRRLPPWLVASLPWLRRAGFLAAIAVVAVVAVDAIRNADFSAMTWWLLVVAVLAATPWWLALGLGWAVLAGGRANVHDVGQWCRTQTLRYLPGGIWAPVSRVAVIRGSALDRITTVLAENVIALCAALAVGGAALALSGRPIWIPLALVCAAPAVLARLLRGRGQARVDVGRASSATATYLLAFAAYALAAVLVQAAVSGWHDPFAVAGSAAIAWAAGLVVVVAPSGVGVREGVYAALVRGAFAAGEPATAAIALRLVTIVAELGVLLAVGMPRSAFAAENR